MPSGLQRLLSYATWNSGTILRLVSGMDELDPRKQKQKCIRLLLQGISFLVRKFLVRLPCPNMYNDLVGVGK